MSETSFFWHDYETFGRDPRLDRPAQFAGIRTDLDLNEVGEPVMLYCKPAPDYLPDPEACLLTGILPQECLAKGLPEYRFADAVLAELGASGTIGVGYNSIRFDDEVTRHLLWRTLRPPYDREWRNGCSRWDLLDVVRATAALRPEGIEWPRYDDGRPSFKLEHLSAANGLAHAQAHDALSDVRATIALAALIRNRQPRLWNFCLALRQKQAVLTEIGSDRPFIHVSAMYGAERGGMAVVWPLAQHPTNRNELIVWDLIHDPAELAALTPEQARQRLFTPAQELPEGTPRLPIKGVHLNKAPIVIAALKTLRPEQARQWGIDFAQAQTHLERLRALPDLSALWQQVYARPETTAAVDVDEDLYGGFVSRDDRRRLDELRRAFKPGSSEPPRLPGFDDARLHELVWRWRARNRPESLTPDEQRRWREHCQARLLYGAGGALTLQSYFDRIDALAQAREDERSQDILGALYEWGEMLGEGLDEAA